MDISFAGICDMGLKRTINQDSILMYRRDPIHLFVVADGMGGYADGEIASRWITDSIRKWGADFSEETYEHSFRDMTISLQTCIKQVNKKIYEELNQDQICGSTCVVLFLYKETYAVISIGDSRIYLRRGWKMKSLMPDDVWENQSSVKHSLSKKQIKQSPHMGKLISAIGTRPTITLSVKTDRLSNRDCFLICSDGLYKYCTDRYMRFVMWRSNKNNLNKLADEMLREIYSSGAKDNISAILVKCDNHYANA